MDEEFKKKIAKDFGFEKMDAEEQERMIEKIGNLLFESVVERAVDAMDEKAMGDFEETLANADSDYQKIIAFFKERAPGFEKIVSEEMSRLKRAASGIFA